MKTKFKGILTLILVFTVHLVFAQKTVSGTVSDESGPLPGVSVLVKGTTTGTETDFDGKYMLQANEGDILQFSYVGMPNVEKTVGASNVIDVVMTGGEVLEEVIVVAYGSKTKDELTSAVSVMNEDDLAKLSPSTTVDNMLQGKAAGVQVVAQNGKPGQTAYLRIRGTGSINASNEPLIIIDGVVAPSMEGVNPNEIESLSVLKDAATASLYGSRAANGVIVIKTKSGKKNNDATVSFSSRVGMGQRIKDNYRMMTTAEKLQYERELALLNVPGTTSLPGAQITNNEEANYYLNLGHDWENTLLRNSTLISNALSISGGSEKISYFMSLGQDSNSGIIKDVDGFERLSGRLNLDYDAKDWLSFNANVSISNYSTDDPRDRNNVQNPFRAMYEYNPYETLYLVDADGAVIYDENGDPEYNLTSQGFSISEALINNPENLYYTTTIAGISSTIKFTERLSNTIKVGALNTNYRREYYVKPGSVLDDYVGDADKPGIKTDNGSFDFDATITNLLNYNLFLGDKHSLKLTGLFEFNKNNYRTYRLSSHGFSSPDISVQSVAAEPTAVSSSLIQSTLLSSGVFVDYNFDGKYILTGSIRRDGSSTFGSDNVFGTFWSSSAAWNLHNEDFMQNVDYVNELKLRASYGTSGNRGSRRSASNYYGHLPLVSFSSLNNTSYSFVSDNGNPNLSWEQNNILDIGLEYQLFNRKLKGVIDYYERTTDDLLYNAQLFSEGGEYDRVIYSNFASMVNKGFEIELSGDFFRSKAFNLNLNGNIAFNNNEVTKTVPTLEDPLGPEEVTINGITIIKPGEELYTFYVPRWAGVDPDTGQPTWYDPDGNITFDHSETEPEVLSGKSPVADFDGGFNLFASYKGFEFGVDTYFKVGNYIMNYMESNMLSDGTNAASNQRVDAFNYWKKPGETDVLPNPIYGSNAQLNSDRWLQKGDYIRVRNITLGYNLPSNFANSINFKSLKIYLQGQNFFTYAPHFNGEPEVGIGSGETSNVGYGAYNLYSYPQTQSLSLGIDLKF